MRLWKTWMCDLRKDDSALDEIVIVLLLTKSPSAKKFDFPWKRHTLFWPMLLNWFLFLSGKGFALPMYPPAS